MRTLTFFLAALFAGCGTTPGAQDAAVSPQDAVTDQGPADASASGAQAVMDLSADTTDRDHWYDLPWPSDLRRTAEGAPDYRGFPVPPTATLVRGVLEIAGQRQGFTALPVGFFRFSGALATRAPTEVIPAEGSAPVLLIDIDPRSPERGRLIPTVAQTWDEDEYLPAHTLAVAAYPGFVLRPERRYAFVLTRALRDAAGAPVRASAAMASLRAGQTPAGDRGAAAQALYAPLWEALRAKGIDPATVVAATVFTTGDAPRELAALGDRVLQRHDVTIEDLRLATGESETRHPRFCQINARVRMPQFQRGEPPFNTEGTFAFDADGLPQPVTYAGHPGYGDVPVVLTIPRRAMGAEGFPLVLYLHGSGGTSTSAVDRGTWRPRSASHPCTGVATDAWQGVTGCFTAGEGPAHVLAQRGFATASQALPVNPERLPGATSLAYLNFANLKAFRDTFRQGVLESRLFIEALGRVRIPASIIAQCTGASLPAGVTEGRFDLSRLIAQGQSMGGMYTNLLSATEPRVRAAIPTGAGGFWSYMVLRTQTVPNVERLLPVVVGTRSRLTHMHPTLALLEMAWEPAEPLVFVSRIARDPLPQHPVRPIYEAVGQGDSYFATEVYDATALAFGHPQLGAAVWPTMQTSLALDGISGLRSYPVSNNLRGADMAPYTGAVIQYAGDGVYDPHAIYAQLDAVKFQYGCFAQSFACTGAATIYDAAGRAADAECPDLPTRCAPR